MYPNIEAERARRGLSQSELASKLKITRKTYYNWLKNNKIPMNKIKEMANIFDVSIDYLLSQKQ